MKRRDVIKTLKAAGFTLREGAKHTPVLRDGEKISVLSRQREIDDNVIRKIEKQTGVKIL